MSAAAALRRWSATVLLLLTVAGAGAPLALAQEARTSLADVEDEVMCVVCGRPLATSSGGAADQERQLIQGWIDEGLTKQQVKARLVGEYGERALVNDRSPIAAAAPWLAAIAGVASITLLLRRRRQPDAATAGSARPAPTAGDAPTVSAADEARIDAELADLD